MNGFEQEDTERLIAVNQRAMEQIERAKQLQKACRRAGERERAAMWEDVYNLFTGAWLRMIPRNAWDANK